MPLSASEDLFHASFSSLASGAQWPSTVSSLLIVGMLLPCTQWEAAELQSTGTTHHPSGQICWGPCDLCWSTLVMGVIGNSEAAQLPFARSDRDSVLPLCGRDPATEYQLQMVTLKNCHRLFDHTLSDGSDVRTGENTA